MGGRACDFRCQVTNLICNVALTNKFVCSLGIAVEICTTSGNVFIARGGHPVMPPIDWEIFSVDTGWNVNTSGKRRSIYGNLNLQSGILLGYVQKDWHGQSMLMGHSFLL